MPKLVTMIMATVKPCSVLAIAVILPFAIGAVPARAQDIFGFFRPFSPPVAAVAAFQPLEYRAAPTIAQPKPTVRLRPKVAHVERPAIKSANPKAPGEVTNPVPDLLADSTLRPGDMVMFPDGLRVFTGQAGGQHKLADFYPVSRAGNTISPSTRTLVAHLRPGTNAAWSADGVRFSGKQRARSL